MKIKFVYVACVGIGMALTGCLEQSSVSNPPGAKVESSALSEGNGVNPKGTPTYFNGSSNGSPQNTPISSGSGSASSAVCPSSVVVQEYKNSQWQNVVYTHANVPKAGFIANIESYGNSFLPESKSVVIPAGMSVTQAVVQGIAIKITARWFNSIGSRYYSCIGGKWSESFPAYVDPLLSQSSSNLSSASFQKNGVTLTIPSGKQPEHYYFYSKGFGASCTPRDTWKSTTDSGNWRVGGDCKFADNSMGVYAGYQIGTFQYVNGAWRDDLMDHLQAYCFCQKSVTYAAERQAEANRGYCPAALVSGKFNGKTTPDLQVVSSTSTDASGLLMMNLPMTRAGESVGNAATCQAGGVWKLGSWDAFYTSKAFGYPPYEGSTVTGTCNPVATEATTVEVQGAKFDIPAEVATGAYQIKTLSYGGKPLNGGIGIKSMCGGSGPVIKGEAPGVSYLGDGQSQYRIYNVSAFKMATAGQCSSGEFYNSSIGSACVQKLTGKAGKIRAYWLTSYAYMSLEAADSPFSWKRTDGYSPGYYGNECFCAD